MSTPMDDIELEEARRVRELGEAIGYGRMMQLAERIWNSKMPGAAHSVGPCVAELVPCPHPKSGRDRNGHCDWCCGSGRVTKKVLAAMGVYDAACKWEEADAGGMSDEAQATYLELRELVRKLSGRTAGRLPIGPTREE